MTCKKNNDPCHAARRDTGWKKPEGGLNDL